MRKKPTIKNLKFKTKTKRRGRFLLPSLLALILLILISFLINFHVSRKMADKIFSDVSDLPANFSADCIIVLGAGVREDGSLSNMLHDRVKSGVMLYFSGVSDRLLMSGDHGSEDYDEVNAMKDYAVENDVPSECVFMDHAGFSTYDSIYRAKEIFKVEKIVIVTQGYHLPRALYLADSFGLEAYGISADLNVYAGQKYRDAREMAARVKDFFTAILKPSPKLLGESIPISGDGNATNDK